MAAPRDQLASPVHVLHVINSFADGGTERQAIQLANALAATGSWRVSVAVLDDRGPLRNLLVPSLLENLAAFPLQRFGSWQSARQLAAFMGLLRRNAVEIIQSHGYYPNVFGIAGAALARVPVRIGSKRESVTLRSPARALLERSVLRNATHLVANCDAVRQELLRSGISADRVTTIRNALHADRISHQPVGPVPATGTILTGENTARCVVMIANFHHRTKDHATLLRAARRVVEMVPDTYFVLAGEGPYRSEARELATALELDASVQFPGRHDDISALLSRADVCVLSSRTEGFPNVILEYMAAQRAVVATDVGGVREAVEDGVTGRLVAAGDDAAMAAAIVALLSDDAQRRRMGEAGRARAATIAPLSHQVEATTALYRGELERAAARRR